MPIDPHATRRRAIALIGSALLDAWALVMPVECAGCGLPDRPLCRACRAALVPEPTPRRTPCGLLVHTALRYEGPVRRALLALKEQNRTDVARALSEPLAVAVAASIATAGAPGLELVAVPSSRRALRRRGYDPLELLLRKAGLAPAQLLRPARRTASQKTLGVAQRAENLRGALRVRPRRGGQTLEGLRVLLVDDVLTTGATLDEATRALREEGATVVGAAALAYTPRMFSAPANSASGNPKGPPSDIPPEGV